MKLTKPFIDINNESLFQGTWKWLGSHTVGSTTLDSKSTGAAQNRGLHQSIPWHIFTSNMNNILALVQYRRVIVCKYHYMRPMPMVNITCYHTDLWAQVLSFLDDIFPALLQALSDTSDEVSAFTLTTSCLSILHQWHNWFSNLHISLQYVQIRVIH